MARVVATCILGCLGLLIPRNSLAQDRSEQPEPVVIGSKEFTENRLLAEIMARLIEERTTIPVERRTNLGGTVLVFTALQSGEIDIYPEYTGTGWSLILKNEERVRDHLRTYTTVAEEFRKRFDVIWLQPFGFNNTYVLTVSGGFAERTGISRISELVRYQDTLRAALSHEFLDREDGYPGLAQWYGLAIPDLRGIEHGLAYAALESGRVDLIDTWSTDGKLLRYDLTTLQDDKGFFPPYDCAPLIRNETLRRHPELRDLLNELAFRLDDETMRRLNLRTEERSGDYAGVAAEFLFSAGLILKTGNERALNDLNTGFGDFFWERRAEIGSRTMEHLALTCIAVLLSLCVAIPLGVLLTRHRILARWCLAAAGVIQTIPGLALIAVMIPVPGLGLGSRTAIAALFLYALLPILRNTYAGILSVDPDLTEAARGMGLTDWQMLTRVELPLSTGMIMAGIRTATVISIGIATLAAFVGAGGLGDPIITGLQLNDMYLILSGALPAAIIAVIADSALGLLERLLSPGHSGG